MNLFLVYPMFVMILLTMAVAVLMFRARVRGVMSGQVKSGYFKAFQGPELAPEISLPARHYTNLFEMPVLFYAGCFAAIIVPVDGPMILFWAWLFVVLRIAHAIIHLGSNRLKYRMRVFGLSLICVLAIWISVILKVSYLHIGAAGAAPIAF